MATVAKRQLALPETLYKELDWLARREGKSVVLILRDLLAEKRKKLLYQEYRTLQGYWSKKSKANPEQTATRIQIDSDALLARARAVRRTPKGMQLTDRLLCSLKEKSNGTPTNGIRGKRERSF